MADRTVNRAKQIAVIGGGNSNQSILELAEAVGRELASRGAVVVTGGLGGVMQAACRGARSASGIALAIIPGDEIDQANQFASAVCVTGMGWTRNALVVRSADALIALPGSVGTRSEIAFADVDGKKVIALGDWGEDGSPQVFGVASTAAEAVELALSAS
jgi:uncharacterized protein (TIGR00725 family)